MAARSKRTTGKAIASRKRSKGELERPELNFGRDDSGLPTNKVARGKKAAAKKTTAKKTTAKKALAKAKKSTRAKKK